MDTKEFDLRIYWVPQLGMEPTFTTPVQSVAEALKTYEILARFDQFLVDHGLLHDCANMGGLEIYGPDGWEEWESGDGDDLDDIRLGRAELPSEAWRDDLP